MPIFVFTVPGGITFDGDQSDWEQAIRSWVIACTGLDDGHVIRADQDGPRPSVPFIEVKVDGVRPLGAVDGEVQTYDSGASAGQEVVRTAHGQREFSAVIRAFTLLASGDNSARAFLSRVQVGLGLEEVRDILYGYGVTVFDNGRIENLPGILDTKWEGRATLTVGCLAEQTAATRTGFIKTVVLTNGITVPDTTLIVQIP